MKKLSRGTWLALAAVTAIPATVAIAKTAEQAGWTRPSPETRARLEEGRIAMAKAALKLSPDQEKLWAPIETQVREAFKARDAKRAEFEKMREEAQNQGTEAKRPDLAERFDKMGQNMSERAERMKAFAAAFRPFYASLSEEQKDVLKPLMRTLAPGMGGRGHGGSRFAEGWGGHGGPGGWFGRGGEHDGGWGHHGRHHGMRDQGGGGAGGPQGPGPDAPQVLPEDGGGNEQGPPPAGDGN